MIQTQAQSVLVSLLFETDFTKNKKWSTKDTTAGHFNSTVKPGN